MADLSPEARRKATDALLEYIGRRWVVCDHAQIIDPGGAVDAVAAALDRNAAEEIKALRGELAGAYAELEKLRARFRLAPGLGRYEADRAPTLVALPRNAVDFLATLVGGTGSDVWGEIALHFGLTADHVRDVFDILTAAARDARCVSCGADLVRQGEEWRHLGTPGCDALIVPEGIA